jgi:hypothetical protein
MLAAGVIIPSASSQIVLDWWIIRRLEETYDVESLYPMLRQFFHLVKRTDDDIVNRWLERVFAHCAERRWDWGSCIYLSEYQR